MELIKHKEYSLKQSLYSLSFQLGTREKLGSNLLGIGPNWRNKKGWIKIFEAFVAISLIFAALLILFTKQSPLNSNEEITKLQVNILDSISNDDGIRNYVLSDNTTGINNKIGSMIPNWLNYSVTICEPESICPINSSYVSSDVLATREIYSSETLILSNVTSFDDKKLKLFFWKL